ncbi:hypothetical protein ACFVUW_01785 [Streptomyces xiamenensis]|uniref:hypothetical protein n=1 Tax=Streptomyces xiamenensis TaxID=408015 RepID=UPI0036E86800
MGSRLAAVAGLLAIAVGSGVGLAAPASAAHGELRGKHWFVTNPSGCVNVPELPLKVYNFTNEYALVYQNRDCTGAIAEVIAPGGTSGDFSASIGRSVWVD